MNYQEKLRKRRLEQEKKLEKQHNKGKNDRLSRVEFKENENPSLPEKDNKSELKEKISEIIKNNYIKREEPKKVTEPVIDETEKEKKERLKTARRNIYNNHINLITKKYEQAIQILDTVFEDKKKDLEETRLSDIEEQKNDLNKALEDAGDDMDDRASAREEYRDNVKDINEEFKESLEEYEDDKKTSLDEIKEEYIEKKTELEEEYKSDIKYIDEGLFDDKDIEISNNNYKTEDMSFEALEEYDINIDNMNGTSSTLFGNSSVSSSNNSSNKTYNDIIGKIFQAGVFLIGFGIIVMIGNTVFTQLGASLDSQTQNVSGMITTSMVSVFTKDNIPFILLFAPLLFIILFQFLKAFLRFGDGGSF